MGWDQLVKDLVGLSKENEVFWPFLRVLSWEGDDFYWVYIVKVMLFPIQIPFIYNGDLPSGKLSGYLCLASSPQGNLRQEERVISLNQPKLVYLSFNH